MLKCSHCGSEVFVTYKKTPVKIDKWCNVISTASEDLSTFNLPEDPWGYTKEIIVCAKCHRVGSFSTFNEIDRKTFS